MISRIHTFYLLSLLTENAFVLKWWYQSYHLPNWSYIHFPMSRRGSILSVFDIFCWNIIKLTSFFYRNVNWIKNQTGKFVHFLSISILIKHMVELIVSGLKWSKNFCCIELYTSVSWVFNWHRKNYQTFWRKSCHLVLATLGGHILSPNCDFLYFW